MTANISGLFVIPHTQKWIHSDLSFIMVKLNVPGKLLGDLIQLKEAVEATAACWSVNTDSYLFLYI